MDMINGFVFDLDGTLLDRDSSLRAFVSHQYDRVSQLQCMDKNLYITEFMELDSRGYVWKDKVYQQLIQAHHLPISHEALLEDYISNFKYHCTGFPHLHESLQELRDRGMKLGMITNGYGEFQLNNIRALEIEQYFDTILISEIEGLRKPDPEIFIRALRNLDLTPHEAVYVGDHPENDVIASRRVGMKGIWKEDLYYDAAFECDYIIRDLTELKHIR